ncbi:MAG: STAS domain-containing protein [Burkholderiales bacterium]|nr:STAS domain-containing protein [Burkholderiales bacterium]
MVNRRLELPPELCVPAVAALRTACLEWLDAEDADPQVDASPVEEVDAAGVQLLVALSHSLAARGRRLHLHAPSEPLRDACRTLGVPELIALPAGDAR